MTTFPTITRIDIRDSIDQTDAEAALLPQFPNATVTVGVSETGALPYAAYAGVWYQADLASSVYAAIADALATIN